MRSCLTSSTRSRPLRPLRLQIEGFTAFRQRQEIDFSELELFAITGPTGAGKTSLLDALVLALYGDVPRVGARNVSQLISHGRQDARVMLEFAVEGERYRVSRRLHRRRAAEARLERHQGGGWRDAAARSGVRAVEQEIQRLVKLDFDAFCKTVLLPQGEFARFLRGEPRERRETLKALLGLEVYERMAASARSHAGELGARIKQIEELLGGEQFANATADGLRQAQQDMGEAERFAQELENAAGQAEDGRRQIADLCRQARQLRDAAGRLRDVASDSRQLACEFEPAEAALADARGALDSSQQALARAQRALERARQQRSELAQKYGRVEELTELRLAAESLPEHERRCAEAEKKAGELAAERAELAEQLRRLDRERERLQADEQQAQALVAERQTALEQAGKRCSELGEGIRQLQATLEECDAAERARQQALEQLERARERARLAGERVKTLEERVDELQRANLAAALCAHLSPGDPCPICERPLQRLPATGGAEAALADAQEQLRKAREVADEASSSAGAARQGVLQADQRLGDARSAREQLIAQLGEPDSARERHARAQEELRRAEDLVKEANSALSVAKERLGEVERAFAEKKGQEDGLDTALEQAQTLSRDVRQQLDRARASVRARFGDPPPADAAERVEKMLAEIERAEGALEQAGKQQEQARHGEEQARGELAKAQRALQTLQQRLAGLLGDAKRELDSLAREPAEGDTQAPEGGAINIAAGALAPLPLAAPAGAAGATASVEEADAAGATALAEWAHAAEQKLIAACDRLQDQALARAREVVAIAERPGLAVGVGAAQEAGAVIEAAENAGDAIKKLLGEAQQALGQARARAESVKQQLKQRRDLEGQIEQDRASAALASQLADELRADHFIGFVLSETLALLAEHATDELLAISDGRYSLHAADDGEFEVVDHHNADERRSVKTLSGGETFMASLALALALSRHVSELAGEGLGARLEAVFIDEGFGSLDGETLEEVLDALERLRHGGLMVGVISHVPEVAVRIGEGLEVRRDGSASTVSLRAATATAP